nr:DUF6398 domain-containing protein [Microvirga tunisiensis]
MPIALSEGYVRRLVRQRNSDFIIGYNHPIWACGIIYVIGQRDFFLDRSFKPFMTKADVCAGFGIGQSTASAKAKVISQALRINPLNPEWSLPSLLKRNPLVWMAEVNGMLVDLREMPREVQEIAFEQGMIPYIPADRDPS